MSDLIDKAEALLPCPFCTECKTASTYFDHEQGDKWGYASCDACGARGPEVRTNYDRDDNAPWRAEAIAAWNRRALPARGVGVKPLAWQPTIDSAGNPHRVTVAYCPVFERRFFAEEPEDQPRIEAKRAARILAGLEPALPARGVEPEMCGKCMGIGYGGHPDSGVLCPDCNGTGGILAAPAPADAARAPAEDAHVKGETAGQMLERLGMDGVKWAAEFRATALRLGYSDMDEGWLIGWFCNAIMAGYDRSAAQTREAAQVIAKNGAEATAAAMILHIAETLRAKGRAVLTTGDDFGAQVLQYADAIEGDRT